MESERRGCLHFFCSFLSLPFGGSKEAYGFGTVPSPEGQPLTVLMLTWQRSRQRLLIHLTFLARIPKTCKKNGSRHECIQEYKGREVDCEVCGSKVRKCNWFRYLGTAKHRDGVETGGGGGDIGGQGKEAEGRS